MGFSNTSTGSTPVLAPSKVEHHLFYCILKTLQTRVCYLWQFCIHHSLCVLGWRGMERSCWPAPGEGRGSRRARSTCLRTSNPATPPPPRPSHRILRSPATTNMSSCPEWKLVETVKHENGRFRETALVVGTFASEESPAQRR